MITENIKQTKDDIPGGRPRFVWKHFFPIYTALNTTAAETSPIKLPVELISDRDREAAEFMVEVEDVVCDTGCCCFVAIRLFKATAALDDVR